MTKGRIYYHTYDKLCDCQGKNHQLEESHKKLTYIILTRLRSKVLPKLAVKNNHTCDK